MNEKSEKVVRLPQSKYGWSLYDAEGTPDGVRAVYGNGEGEWLVIRPDAKPPQHEVQMFSEDGEASDSSPSEITSLIYLLEENFSIRLREEVETGGAAEAYNFALLQ